MSLKEKLENFNRKSYQVLGIRGVLISAICFLVTFLLLAVLESTFWFDTTTRMILFFILVFLTGYLLVKKVILPLLIFLGFRSGPSNEITAKRLSEDIPELKDELINYLQLENDQNELSKASVDQRGKKLSAIDFLKAIDYSSNKRYLKAFFIVVLLFTSVAFISPPTIAEGSSRLVRYSKDFVKPAPFSIQILNDSLTVFKNQPFELRVKLEGKNVPEDILLVTDESEYRLEQISTGEFIYSFRKVSKEVGFHLDAAGFRSKAYRLEIRNKPVLNLMSIELDYPDYTNLRNEKLTNSGHLNIPPGTKVKWEIETDHAENAYFDFNNEKLKANRINATKFEFEKKVDVGGLYQIQLENQFAENESELSYDIDIIPDEFPRIEVQFSPDTSFYKFVIVTGEIADDYGFKSLQLVTEAGNKTYRQDLEINTRTKRQQFFTEWFADSIQNFDAGNLNIYLTVTDNDAVSGFKSSKSTVFQFNKPDLAQLSDIIEKKSQKAENQLDNSLKEIDELRKKLDELSKRLKSQKETDWRDEKLIEESLEQRAEIDKMLQELKEKHDDLIKANKNFEQSEAQQQKSEQLNELIKDLMDDETRQLYDELKKLLEEKSNKDELREKLNQINRHENRMQQDLERTKELFKRMKIETGLEQVAQQLDSLASKQMDLSEQAQDSSAMTKQNSIKEDFNQLAEKLDDLAELNQELKKPEPLQDFDSDEKQINQEMDEAMDQMEKGEQKKSKKSQKDAAKQMQQMSKKLQQMQAGMEMEVMQENIEHLRKILDDLVKLSFKQEGLIGDFRGVNSSDPRFIKLSQEQVKLKEDLVVIEDSLLALAGRVVQLSSFITKEVEEIDYHMSGSVEQIRERQRGRALSHQQFSMTSMNNLALMLNDVLQQMQMSMSEAMGNPSKGQPKNMPLPSIGELQQKLGEKIQDLGKDGKSGPQLSEELARLAAEQEMLREQLRQLQENMNGQFGNENISDNLSKVMELMEDNEVDLVNKRISRQLIERQKEIETRMLDAEDALREQEQDPEREGNTANQRDRILPPSFEDYLKERKKEIELLRSIPIDLKPFYKKEVNEYFKRLSETD